MSNEPFVIKSADYHRNGVSGTGFFIGLVEYTKRSNKEFEPGETLQIIAITTEDDGSNEPSFYSDRGVDVFVTSVASTDRGSVAFGSASFRGDHFTEEATAIVRTVRTRPVGF